VPTITDKLFDENARVATLRDGRVIAWSRYGAYVDFGADGEYDSWLQRVPDLRKIEYVLDVNIDWGIPTSDKTTTSDDITYKINIYGPAGKSIYGNVVGMTLLGRATNLEGGTLQAKTFGTSVYVDIIAIGPP